MEAGSSTAIGPAAMRNEPGPADELAGIPIVAGYAYCSDDWSPLPSTPMVDGPVEPVGSVELTDAWPCSTWPIELGDALIRFADTLSEVAAEDGGREEEEEGKQTAQPHNSSPCRTPRGRRVRCCSGGLHLTELA